MSKQISYATRDFQGLRNELVTLTKNYYPDLVKNFNDASIYSVLLDINAAVADNLHFHIDRVWQETMLDFAQQKQSLINEHAHYILKAAHPSPLSAHNGFLGCRHFSKTNQLLVKTGRNPIDWNP